MSLSATVFASLRRSMNALMQYLKRKQLIKKTGPEFSAPYTLTEEGHAVLAEMTRRKGRLDFLACE
jgi:hypothetical protein